MSQLISTDDTLFKIYGILNTTYYKDFQLKDELFGRIFYHVFNRKHHSTKITECFKSWLSIIIDRIKNNQDFNFISYNEIIKNSNNMCSVGTCSNMFKMLEHAGLIHKVWRNGSKANIELDIDSLVQLFIDNQVFALEELDNIVESKKKSYNRRRRYAMAKKVCDTYNLPQDREEKLIELSFGKAEALVYDLIDTFYVRYNNPNYHITFADVMTVMGGISSYDKNKMSMEDWDNIVFTKIASRDSGVMRRLIDAIKNPKTWNKSFKTPYYCRLVKESYLDNNCSFDSYSSLKMFTKEDTKLLKRIF